MSQVEIDQLSLQQLAEIRKQFEAEIDHLSDSSTKLRQALAKFMDCSQSVSGACASADEGTQIMIPLTGSLYVPGKIADTDKFIVDVGTNYFVEKDAKGAVEFFNKKVDSLGKNIVDLEKLLNEKVGTLRNVDMVFKKKYSETKK
ncbi:Gim5 protein [Starmerella bacillaris]|uniref:Gim5 protein n=1 Tax=Starmerella bacillaris TaxID=1247836 RepID=A0AAV5RIR8_STABA|nr:Gim5 protein [Starmerella bacillaris]